MMKWKVRLAPAALWAFSKCFSSLIGCAIEADGRWTNQKTVLAPSRAGLKVSLAAQDSIIFYSRRCQPLYSPRTSFRVPYKATKFSIGVPAWTL